MVGKLRGEVNSGSPNEARRPVYDDPGQFHLRQPGNLREAAHGERQQAAIRGEALGQLFRQFEVQEHFVGQERDPLSRTNLVEL